MVWYLDNLETIGGHSVEVLGAPRLVDGPVGKAVEFDGVGDALLFAVHPLAGLEAFTAEVVFRPYPDGLVEQRFFHMQEADTEDRMLFETRLTGDGQWFLDTYVQSGDGHYTQFAEDSKHPLGPWYHAAFTVGDGVFRHYVDGQLELETQVNFKPQQPGRMSLGVRLNRVCWYKGAIAAVRFAPEVLDPSEFLSM